MANKFGNIGAGKQIHIFAMTEVSGKEKPIKTCNSGRSGRNHYHNDHNIIINDDLSFTDVTCQKCLTKFYEERYVELLNKGVVELQVVVEEVVVVKKSIKEMIANLDK